MGLFRTRRRVGLAMQDPCPPHGFTLLSSLFLCLFVALLLTVVIGVNTDVKAEGAVDDFEWLVPVHAPPITLRQRPMEILIDQVTDETYVIWTDKHFTAYDTEPVTIHVSRYYSDTMGLELIYSHEYIGYFGSLKFSLVHDGRWYFFFQTDDQVLHLRIDNATSDRLNWTFKDEEYNRYLMRALLGVYDGRMYFMAAEDEEDVVAYELYSFNISSFSWNKEHIFDLRPNHQWTDMIMRDGRIYCIQDRRPGGGGNVILELFTFDLRSREGTGPTHISTAPSNQWGGKRYAVDSMGFIHLLRSNLNLTKYSINGVPLESIQIVKPPGTDGIFSSNYDLIINRNDQLTVVKALKFNRSDTQQLLSFTVTRDYDPEVLYHNISGIMDTGSYIYLAINGSDTVMVIFEEFIDDLNRLSFSMQIEPSPDLVISPLSFELEEIPGTVDPVWLSFNIDNLGRATSRSHWISVQRKPSAGTAFYEITRLFEDVEIAPGGSQEVDIFISIPKGNCRLLLLIEDVDPFENIRSNNAFEVLVYIRVNNPPTLSVGSPEDGSVVRDILPIHGRTDDMDANDNVTTSITGLPGEEVVLYGIGEWSSVIDISNVPSGDYVLVFQASDGEDLSTPVVRHVRVDPIKGSLDLVSYWPMEDIDLLLGETGVMMMNASDRFGRPVTHQWSVDGLASGSNGSMFYFTGIAEGEFLVKGVASNHLKSMTRVWNVTVRAPLMPTISGMDPEGVIVLSKNQDLELSIEVSNPDDIEYSVQWFSDGHSVDPGNARVVVLSYGTSGDRSVSVILTSSLGHDDHNWTVRVLNRAPEMTSWSPPENSIILERPGSIIFLVSASDPDGDDLSYSWACMNLSDPLGTDHETTVLFNGSGYYRVTLDISDGEDTVRMVWEVQVPYEERTEPPPEPDGWTVPVLAWVLLLVLSTIIAAVIVYRVRKDGGDQDRDRWEDDL